MCVPPLCEPATRCFGCLSLKCGTILALILNALYGLGVVMLHALLLSENHKQVNGFVATPNGLPVGTTRDHWLMQFIDLDLSWGHRLMGFDDFKCLISGLGYGLLIIVATIFALNSLCKADSARPVALAYFVVFAHFELVMYFAVNLAKYPQLCKLRREYYPSLEATCDVLRFAFVERCVFGLFLGSMVLWIVGSFAYLTARNIDPDTLDDSDEEGGFPGYSPQYVLPPIVQNYSHPMPGQGLQPPSIQLPSFNSAMPTTLPSMSDARSFTQATTVSAGNSGTSQPMSLLKLG